MMSFRTILVSLLFVAMTKSHPIAYSAYDEKESSQNHTPLVLLVDRHNPEMENEMFDSGSDPGSTVIREKRIGSLSIVNSLDVLRQRVLLELARRKALQDQRQIDANRRILESIGKRTYYNDGLSKATGPVSEFGYVLEQEEKDDDRGATPEGFTDRVQHWLRTADSSFRENQVDDQARAVKTNEVRLL